MRKSIPFLMIMAFFATGQVIAQENPSLSECKKHLSELNEKVNGYRDFCAGLKEHTLDDIRLNSETYANKTEEIRSFANIRNFSDFSVEYIENADIAPSACVKTISEAYTLINQLISNIQHNVGLLNESMTREELNRRVDTILKLHQKLTNFIQLNYDSIK